ncbi:MAG: histidine phosphatase family protein [Bacteroidota bacterium]
MTTLYFVRHGQTDYNLKGIVQGSGIDAPLNATGIAQANAFFRAYSHLSFDAVYASTLQRTHQTLAPWIEAGYAFSQHPGLNEFNWGIHEGKVPTPEEHQSFLAILNRWQEGELEARVPEGETPIDAWERAKTFFQDLPKRHPDQQLLLCTHGRQLRVILSNLLKVGMQNMEPYKHRNTGLTIVGLTENGQATLELLNDGTHLEALNV